MKVFKAFLYFLSATVLCIPLVIVICQGEDSNVEPKSIAPVSLLGERVCSDGNINNCILLRDQALQEKKYAEAFVYLKTLCDRYQDSDSCLMTYETFFNMQETNKSESQNVKTTLYEVLYYLDLGCKLNNYSACMRAARIYEYGVKPDSSQALYGFNVAYDAQEAKRYYKKVCESISDDAPEACKKIVDLTHKTHSYKYLIKKQ